MDPVTKSIDLCQLIEEPLRGLQIGGPEPLGEAVMDRRQEIARASGMWPWSRRNRARLVVDRSSQDKAPCRRAKSSEREKLSSATVAFDLPAISRSSPLTRNISGK